MMPYVNIAVVIMTTKLNKIKDGGLSTLKEEKIKETKALTIQQFIDIYAGPQTQLHIRYAFIFNTVFVNFTYGLALPLLFPITLFTMINMYVSERYLFAYYYRKPPIFGGGMNDGALTLLTYAPLAMIAFGYW